MSRKPQLSPAPERRAAQLANLRPAPPAPVGNQRTLKHGGRAVIPRDRLDERAAEIFEALAEVAPLRDAEGQLPRADEAIVFQLARCIERLLNVGAWLDEHGVIDGRGKVYPAADLEVRLRNQFDRLASSLGMTPASRARLGVDLSRTLSEHDRLKAHLDAHHGEGIV